MKCRECKQPEFAVAAYSAAAELMLAAFPLGVAREGVAAAAAAAAAAAVAVVVAVVVVVAAAAAAAHPDRPSAAPIANESRVRRTGCRRC